MEQGRTEVATLAGGCFWCLEAVFLGMRGVVAVASGYTGGETREPSYEEVCSGETGHAEAVQIHFDPAEIAFDDLLEVFFAIHDPTTLNRQGSDAGTQYRSAIYCHSPEQQAAARAKIAALTAAGAYADPIVTEVAEAQEFWPAEDYHHNYYAGHRQQPYCLFVVGPKVDKFRKQYAGYAR